MREMLADFILIEMFQASVTGIVKQYHYQHNLSLGNCRLSVILAFVFTA